MSRALLSVICLILMVATAQAKPPKSVKRWFKRAKLTGSTVPVKTLAPEVLAHLKSATEAPQPLTEVRMIHRRGSKALALLIGGEPNHDTQSRVTFVELRRKGTITTLDHVTLKARPSQTRWTIGAVGRFDADRLTDATLLWTSRRGQRTRTGLIITGAGHLTALPLGSDSGPAARILFESGCFLRIDGTKNRALMLYRRSVGASVAGGESEIVEFLLPNAKHHYVRQPVYAATFASKKPLKITEKVWRKTFKVSRKKNLSQQKSLGRCPADGIILPISAIDEPGDSALQVVIGPFALSKDRVRGLLKKMKKSRAPKAALIIGLGHAE